MPVNKNREDPLVSTKITGDILNPHIKVFANEDSPGSTIPLYDDCAAIVNSPKRKDRVQQWKEEIGVYYNAQWTQEESTDMDNSGQVDVILNTLRRALRTLTSQMSASNPTAKFMPRSILPNPEENEMVRLALEDLQGLWDHCWYISGGPVVLRRAIQNQVTCGIGWLNTYLDHKADYYRGEVKFQDRIPWEMVIPLYSSKMDFSDARKQYYRTQITFDEAVSIVGSEYAERLREEAAVIHDDVDYDIGMYAPGQVEIYATKIKEQMGGNVADKELMVEWIEAETKIETPATLWKITRNDNIIDTFIHEPVDGNEDGEKLVRAMYPDVPPANLVSVDIGLDRIRKQILAGRTIEVHNEILRTSSYSNIPVIDEDSYNPLSYGEAFFVAPAQKLLNKVFSLAILHLQTSGSGDKLVGLKGAFGDTDNQIDEFQKRYAQPTSATELGMENTDGMTISNVIMRMQSTPMQPAAVQAITMLTSWIDRLVGVHPTSWGDPSGAPRTLGATLSIKEWGDESKSIPMMHLDFALQRLGDNWLEKAMNHYTYPKEVGVPDQHGMLKHYQFNYPMPDGMILNDLSSIKSNIFITHGTSLSTNRYATMMMFKELMPIHPVFAKMFLLYSDIPEKFDLMQEMDHTANLEAQMQQLIPQLEQLQQLAESKDEEIQKAMKKIDMVKFRSTLTSIETKYREFMKAQTKFEDLKTQIRIEQNVNRSQSE